MFEEQINFFITCSVVTVNNGEVHKQTVTLSTEPEEQPVNLVEKPGAKHQKLRGELQQQILQRRSELWQHKTVPGATSNTGENEIHCTTHCILLNNSHFIYLTVLAAEKLDTDLDEALLDDVEEDEFTDSEQSCLEDEDVDLCDAKPKVKSVFVDDEVGIHFNIVQF